MGWTTQLVPSQRSARVFPFPFRVTAPTAVHTVCETHDTPRSSEGAPVGVSRTCQVLPSQRSASTRFCEFPTAMQNVAETHDTDVNRLMLAPGRLGGCWMPQLVPFQRSASVAKSPNLSRKEPTAMHTDDPTQDTEISVPFVSGRFGVRCKFHAASPLPRAAPGAPNVVTQRTTRNATPRTDFIGLTSLGRHSRAVRSAARARGARTGGWGCSE